jgi:hypothetical protein
LVTKIGTNRTIQTVAEAVEMMKKYDIRENSCNERAMGRLAPSARMVCFKKYFLIRHKEFKVENVMERPILLVEFNTPVEKLSTLSIKKRCCIK